MTGHAGGSGQNPVGADEIAALSDPLARKPYRLVVVVAAELSVGGDAKIDRRKRIARTAPPGTRRRRIGLFPAPAISQSEAVIALGEREIRIEPQRQLELG